MEGHTERWKTTGGKIKLYQDVLFDLSILIFEKSNQFLKALHSNIIKVWFLVFFFCFARSYLALRLNFLEADRLHTSFQLAGLDYTGLQWYQPLQHKIRSKPNLAE